LRRIKNENEDKNSERMRSSVWERGRDKKKLSRIEK